MPAPPVMVRPDDGVWSSSENVSSGSSMLSSVVRTVMVAVVAPAGMVSVVAVSA